MAANLDEASSKILKRYLKSLLLRAKLEELPQLMNDPDRQQNLETIEQEISNMEESYSVAYKSIR